jgi:hypothetical protein
MAAKTGLTDIRKKTGTKNHCNLDIFNLPLTLQRQPGYGTTEPAARESEWFGANSSRRHYRGSGDQKHVSR